jgi:hypothetical protein
MKKNEQGTFICQSQAEVLKILKQGSRNQSHIMIGEMANRMTQENLKAGLSYSQPTYSSGLKLIIRKITERSLWSFLAPLTVEVGVGFIVSTFFIGILIWIFEEKKWRRPMKEHLMNISEVIYDTFASFYQANNLTLRKLSSRILQWTFWFSIIIFVAIYQADLTGKLSSTYFERKFKNEFYKFQ